MNCFTMTESKTNFGIKCQRHERGCWFTSWFISLGEEGLGNRRLTMIPVANEFATTLVTKRDGKEEITLNSCAVVRMKGNGTPLIVKPQPGDGPCSLPARQADRADRRALVKLYIEPEMYGSNYYDLGEGTIELGRGTYCTGRDGYIGRQNEILVVMEPGTKIIAHRRGKRLDDYRDERIVYYDGNEILIFTPEETDLPAVACLTGRQEVKTK